MYDVWEASLAPVNLFSQARAFTQYSRNLHKIFIEAELCNVNRNLSTVGHRKSPCCDEKEDWARLVAPLRFHPRDCRRRELGSVFSGIGSDGVPGCVRAGLTAALFLAFAGRLTAQTDPPARPSSSAIPPPRTFPVRTRATHASSDSTAVATGLGGGGAAGRVQDMQPRPSGGATEAIPDAVPIPAPPRWRLPAL